MQHAARAAVPSPNPSDFPEPPGPRGRRVLNLIRRVRHTTGLFAELREEYGDVVAYRRESGGRSDLISLLVRAEDEEGVDQAFSDDEVRDEAFVLLMVGHDTSSSAMTFCLDYMARNPAVVDRLEQEIDDVIGTRSIEPDDFGRWPFDTMEAVYTLASLAQRWPVEAVSPKSGRINSTGVYRISEGLALRVRERRRA